MARLYGSSVVLSPQIRPQLEALIQARSTPQALAQRCRIILRVADSD